MNSVTNIEPVDYVFKSHVVDREKRIVSGLATVENEDREYDIIDRDSVKSVFKNYMENPVVLMFHDQKRPVAKVYDHKNDVSKSRSPAIRVWVQHGFSKDPSSDVEKSWEMVEQGILNAFSVRVKPAYVKKLKNGLRTGHRIYAKELLEISYVTLPGNKETLIDTIIKSLDLEEEPNMDELLKALEAFKTELKDDMSNFQKSVREELAEVKKSLPEKPKPQPPAPQAVTLAEALKNEDFKKELDTFVNDKISNSKELGVLNKALGDLKGQGDDGDKDDNPEPNSYGVKEYQEFLKTY